PVVGVPVRDVAADDQREIVLGQIIPESRCVDPFLSHDGAFRSADVGAAGSWYCPALHFDRIELPEGPRKIHNSAVAPVAHRLAEPRGYRRTGHEDAAGPDLHRLDAECVAGYGIRIGSQILVCFILCRMY